MFSPAAGPFQQRHLQSSSQTPFQRLKPVCVELLSLAGRRTTVTTTQSHQIVECLRRLKITLKAFLSETNTHLGDSRSPTASTSKLIPAGAEDVLTPPLINYVFFPLSELINSAPKGITSLPDSVAEATLDVIQLLCSQWWKSWASELSGAKHWQVWCDLVILSSSVLGSPASKDGNQASTTVRHNDEVKLSAIAVLDELLCPRFKPLQSISTTGQQKVQEADWEWDGVSDLPLLDDQEDVADNAGNYNACSSREDVRHVFPTPAHLSYVATDRVAKGAISFVLSSCLTLAESSRASTEVRSSAIGAARHALLLWIGGLCHLPSAIVRVASCLETPSLCYIDFPSTPPDNKSTEEILPQLAAAHRLRPLLPGITSSLTRLATSRVKSKQDGAKPKPTPSSVAAGAIELLSDLFRATLSDEALCEALSPQAKLSSLQSQTASKKTSMKVTDLEDFAGVQLIDDHSPDSTSANVSKDDEARVNHATTQGFRGQVSADKDAQWALSTLAQVHVALKSFSTLTQPSLSGTSLPSSVHTSVKIAILHLAGALLSECAGSFGWLDIHLADMARLDTKMNSATASDMQNSSSITTLLTWIIDLSSELNSDAVAQSAKTVLWDLQKKAVRGESKGDLREPVQLSNGSILWSVLMQALNSLPAAITDQDDGRVSRLALRVGAVLEVLHQHMTRYSLASTGGSTSIGLAKLAHDLQDTCVRLLRPLKVDRLQYVEETLQFSTSTTWRLQPTFCGLEASTSSQLSRMFYKLGRSLALSHVHEIKRNKAGTKLDLNHMFSLVTFLIAEASRSRSVRLSSVGVGGALDQDAVLRDESLASLVVATDLLRGVSSCLDNLELGLQFSDMGPGATQASRLARKVAHKLGKKVFASVMDMFDGDAEEAIRLRSDRDLSKRVSDQYPDDAIATSKQELAQVGSYSENTIVERVKGISLAPDNISSSTPARHGTALDLGFVRAADLSRTSRGSQAQNQLSIQHRYRQAERQIDWSNALLFSLLGSSSKLLGQSFRSLLLHGAYPLISGMCASSSASSDLVRQASASATKDIAFNTAYADVKNCLLDHADYILGSACQRLISGLDEELRAIASASNSGRADWSTTLALKTGEQSLVVLPLVSAQRAPFVLIEMIRVLGSEIIPMVEDALDEILDALDRFHHHPSICDGLLAVLDAILETMAMEQATKLPTSVKINWRDSVASEWKRDEVDIFKTWIEARKRDANAFDDATLSGEHSSAGEKEEEGKPNKSQQVATQILIKASMFLTHPSPILRSRVLGLLRHGVETLAPQARTAELLPIVNSAWPFVMTRLGAAYSNAKASTTSRLVPIIDLDASRIRKSARGRDEAWYSKLEQGFVERDAGVWVAAAKFVEATARMVPEFVGKRVVEDAWPRFEALLTLVRYRFDARMARGAAASNAGSAAQLNSNGRENSVLLESENPASSSGPIISLIQTSSSSSSSSRAPRQDSSAHTHVDAPFILPSTTSLPAQLTLCIVNTLVTVVRHLNARMPDETAWNITTHETLLGLLDARQPAAIQRAAEQLYVELGNRSPAATTWVIQSAFPTAAKSASLLSASTPCFMHHARSNVHAETVYRLLDCFAGV